MADRGTVRARNTPNRAVSRPASGSSDNLAYEQPRRNQKPIRLDYVRQIGVAFEIIELLGNRKTVPVVHTSLFTRYEVNKIINIISFFFDSEYYRFLFVFKSI